MFENDFNKLMETEQRKAMRRGGPMDEIVAVPCELCGKTREVALRRFYHKHFPRCLDCGASLNKQAMERLMLDRLRSAAERLSDILHKRNQQR